MPDPPPPPSAHKSVLESHLDAPGQRHGQQPISGPADPEVVKQDKSSRGSVDTTKNTFGPTEGQNVQWREANRRRQRQTNQHYGLVPTAPLPQCPPPLGGGAHWDRSPPPPVPLSGGFGCWAWLQTCTVRRSTRDQVGLGPTRSRTGHSAFRLTLLLVRWARIAGGGGGGTWHMVDSQRDKDPLPDARGMNVRCSTSVARIREFPPPSWADRNLLVPRVRPRGLVWGAGVLRSDGRHPLSFWGGPLKRMRHLGLICRCVCEGVWPCCQTEGLPLRPNGGAPGVCRRMFSVPLSFPPLLCSLPTRLPAPSLPPSLPLSLPPSLLPSLSHSLTH